jgi:hypothetical protein
MAIRELANALDRLRAYNSGRARAGSGYLSPSLELHFSPIGPTNGVIVGNQCIQQTCHVNAAIDALTEAIHEIIRKDNGASDG